MRGKIDEFTAFLIIGLVIIALSFVFLGGLEEIERARNATTTTTTTLIETTTTTTTLPAYANLVGVQRIRTWRSIELGDFHISHLSNLTFYGSERAKVTNGLLFGKSDFRVEFDAPLQDLIGASITFEVLDTNAYGDLIIKLNGVEVFREKVQIGVKKEIEVNLSLLREKNELVFECSSSGWRIWAPTKYELKNAGVKILTKRPVPAKLTFYLYSSEVERLTSDKGKISFSLSNFTGEMLITLNGNLIANLTPTSTFALTYFNQSLLKAGENELLLEASENARFDGEARVTIYYYHEREGVYSDEFLVNETSFEKLNVTNGSISFNVTRVYRKGGLAVSIIDASGVEHVLGYERVEEKGYRFAFDKNSCSIGRNRVLIRAIDDALFELSEVKVNLPA